MPRTSVRNQDAVRFGAIVSRIRKQRGWTMVDFARATKMHPNYLHIVERGGNVPTLATIMRIAATLGVEASAIIREVEEMGKKASAPAPQPSGP